MNGSAAYSSRSESADANELLYFGKNLNNRLLLLTARSIALALLYYVMVVISLKLHLSTSTLSLIWPSNALLVAALTLSERRHWWMYLLAVIPAHIAAMHAYHPGFWWITYQIVFNSLLAVVCALVLQRFRPEILHFETLKEVLIFLAVSIIAPGGIALLAVYPTAKLAPNAALLAHGWSRDASSVLTGRWITNSASIMVFVPAMLMCMTRGRAWIRNLSLLHVLEASLLTILLFTVSLQIYGHVYVAGDVHPMAYLIPVPLLLWAAVRFGPAGAALSITVLVCVSSWCVYVGEGPFLSSISVDHVTFLQLFWITVAAPVFSLAAVVQELKIAARDSLKSDARFRYLLTHAPIGIALEDMDGRLLFANPALSSMLGYTPEELTSMNCSQFADPEDEQEDWEQFQAMRNGIIQRYQIEKRYRRKDGDRIWGRLNVSILRSATQSIVFATVEDITEKRAALEELKSTHAKLEQLTPHLLAVQEEERLRISRELHDDFGQRMALLIAELNTMGSAMPRDKVWSPQLHKLTGDLEEIVTDLHNMSHRLHSWRLEILGLVPALNDLCGQFASKHHIAVQLTADQLPELSSEVSLCLFRVAQEAFTNAVKHSGSPRVDVYLIMDGRKLRLRIRDFGIGFNPAVHRSGLGLISIQERLRMIGGTVRFNPVTGGTELEAEVPLEPAEKYGQARQQAS